MPPRAGKNRFQSFKDRGRFKFPNLFKFFGGWACIPSDNLKALAFSIIPGLGQLYLGERTRAVRFFLIWLAPLALGSLLYGPSPRSLIFLAPYIWTMAMIVHTIAAGDAVRPHHHCRTLMEARVVYICLIIVIMILYYMIGSTIQGRIVIFLQEQIQGIQF